MVLGGKKRTVRWTNNQNLEIFGTPQVNGKTPQRSEKQGGELGWPRDGETKGNAATSISGLFFESNMATNSKQFVTHGAL